MLMNPVIADYIQAYGEGGLRAQQARRARAARARLLVHGRVRPGAAGGRPAHLRRRASSRRTPRRVFALDDASPNRIALRSRARDAHALPDRRFPGNLLRASATSTSCWSSRTSISRRCTIASRGQQRARARRRAAGRHRDHARHRSLPRGTHGREPDMTTDARTVFMTGAAGISAAPSPRHLRNAARNLVLAGRRREPGSEPYGNENAQRLFAPADLLDQRQVEAAVATAVARFGRIDVLCNIAGGFRMGDPVHETRGRRLELPVRRQPADAAPRGARGRPDDARAGRRQGRQRRRPPRRRRARREMGAYVGQQGAASSGSPRRWRPSCATATST